jgi:hypothetical protein
LRFVVRVVLVEVATFVAFASGSFSAALARARVILFGGDSGMFWGAEMSAQHFKVYLLVG